MTASLLRRLTDLGTDAEVHALARYFREEGNASAIKATTTTDFLAAAPRVTVDDLARAISDAAAHANKHMLVAAISEPVRAALEAGDSDVAARLLTRGKQFHDTKRLVQHADISYELLPAAGKEQAPVTIIRMPDGKPLEQATVRDSGRKREARRYTLSAEAIDKIDRIAKRDETSASAVVDAAVMAYERRAR